MAELRCEGVTKSFGTRTVLSGVGLVVEEGTLTAILGASGSGKTTLLRAIIGFLRLDAGMISVGGTIVADGKGTHLSPERRGVGYVAQEGALYPHLSVGDNVGFGLPRSERKGSSRIEEVLGLVGLSLDYAGRRPHELSGGEQRRVALARALAPKPRLVLLDEPFSGLDAALRVETRDAVSRALLEEGTTSVLVTHDQSEALSMGREVAVLREGRLVQTAPPAAVYATPTDVEVARFVGDAVVLPGHLENGRVSCALGELAVTSDTTPGSVLAVLRPEQIKLRRGSDKDGSYHAAGPRVIATVVGRTYYGPDTVVRVALEGARDTLISARTFSHGAPEIGEIVEIDVAGTANVYPVEASDEVPGPR